MNILVFFFTLSMSDLQAWSQEAAGALWAPTAPPAHSPAHVVP